MPTDIVADVSIKKKVEELHLKIVGGKENLKTTWTTLAVDLSALKKQMEVGGDPRLNWQAYFEIESFEEYCENKAGLSFKTCYQLISSLAVLENEFPKLLQEDSSTLPGYTKVRILGTKEAKELAKNRPRDYQKIVEDVLDPNVSRRDLEREFKSFTNESPVEMKRKKTDLIVDKVKSYFESQKENVANYVKKCDESGLNKFARGLHTIGLPISTRVESEGIKRIVISNSSQKTKYSKEVVKRARNINSRMELVYTGVGDNGTDILSFPSQLLGAGNYWYMKETLYIRERKSTFIDTFPSPGDIVENLNTALKLGFHCRSTCHYCYQQTSKGDKQEIYSNMERVKNELKYEPFIHTMALTAWSLISHLTKKTFNKIPPGLKDSINSHRDAISKSNINKDVESLEFLSNNIKDILKDCKITYEPDNLDIQMLNIARYYKKNKKVPLWLWVSEYSDILAIEPIAKQMEYIMTDLLDVNPDVNFMVATKSAHGDCFLNHDGQNRVMLNMNLNPEQVIAKYETGTASLDERLELVKKLQDKGGYVLRLSFEPMIYFDGWEQAYKDLVVKVAGSIDLSSIPAVVLGSIRLRRGLKDRIMRDYPFTDLFTNSPIKKASREDERGRYPESVRIDQYRLMIDELAKHTKAEVILGAEHPDIWDNIGLDKGKFLADSVYQFI